ncbi:hypothetical protein MUP77_25665, partial [Candidatus Bathyarchaeota archaeon]|nr:hypothetical protein [Candidatus Bathyarchaeota archaeon]
MTDLPLYRTLSSHYERTIRIKEIYSWASQLAAESRFSTWMNYYYVWPKTVLRILDRLGSMSGGIIGLLGLQGVGKSSALRALYVARMRMAEAKRRVRSKEQVEEADYDVIFFKWRRKPELFQSLLDGIHEASTDFDYEYKKMLSEELESRSGGSPFASKFSPELISVDSAERELGGTAVKNLRQITWLLLLRRKNLILIDTPDYSKTDRRVMAKDLQDIYWLWNTL